MRGKASAASIRNFAMGITPAYAGKSKGSGYQQERGQDHPRLCGEKRLLPVSSLLHTGSPPPMRGKVITRDDEETVMRITPAYAGKSL